MTIAVLLTIIIALVAINVYLWKSGVVAVAEDPQTVIDRPVMDPKERRAVLKRLARWKEEGKLSREEYERFSFLCAEEWDGETD